MLKVSCKPRKWQDKEGNDRYTTEILGKEMNMLGGRQASSGSDAYDQSPPPEEPAQPQNQIFLRKIFRFKTPWI